jgi:hypothetical protein
MFTVPKLSTESHFRPNPNPIHEISLQTTYISTFNINTRAVEYEDSRALIGLEFCSIA